MQHQIIDSAFLLEYEKQAMNNVKQQRISTSAELQKVRGSFVVGSFNNAGGASISDNPVVHTNSHSARIECLRLAKLQPGTTYFFMQIIGGEFVPTSVTTSF